MTYPANDIAPEGYKAYSLGTPEFRLYEHPDGKQTMQVRYVSSEFKYTGLWMEMPVKRADEK